MTCQHCGHEVLPGQRFCSHCGAPLAPEAPQPQQPPAPPEPSPQPPLSNPDTLGLALKIFAIVCAVVYGIRALANLYGAVFNLFHSYRWWGIIPLFTGTLIPLLLTVVYLWMCLNLALTALRRTPDNSDALFLGLSIGGAAAIVLLVLRVLLTLIGSLGYYGIHISWWQAFLLPLLGHIIAVGGVFLLQYLMGEAPLLGKTVDEIKAIAALIPAVLSAVFSSLSNGAAKQQPQAPYTYQQAPQTSQQTFYAGQPQQQPSYGYTPSGPLKTDRGLLVYILLTIITCGIYSYYFLYCLARDVNTVCEGDGKNTGGLAAFILLSLVTCGFYALYWYYCLGNRLAANAPRYGMNFQENGTTVLVWYLVGALLCGIGPFVAMHILMKNTNALCAAYNQAHGFYGN